MLRYPESENNWQELKVGDRVVVSGDVPAAFGSGKVGTLVEIDQQTFSYTVEFGPDVRMTYDGDELRKATIQGRPTVYDSIPFNLRELSRDVVDYIDSTKGEKTRRARIEDIIREHKGQ